MKGVGGAARESGGRRREHGRATDESVKTGHRLGQVRGRHAARDGEAGAAAGRQQRCQLHRSRHVDLQRPRSRCHTPRHARHTQRVAQPGGVLAGQACDSGDAEDGRGEVCRGGDTRQASGLPRPCAGDEDPGRHCVIPHMVGRVVGAAEEGEHGPGDVKSAANVDSARGQSDRGHPLRRCRRHEAAADVVHGADGAQACTRRGLGSGFFALVRADPLSASPSTPPRLPPEIALVTDMSGLCSAGATPHTVW